MEAQTEARVRDRTAIETELEAFGFMPSPLRERLTGHLLGSLATTAPAMPDGGVRSDLVLQHLVPWADAVFGDRGPADVPAPLLARVAFRRCGGAERWPEVIGAASCPDDLLEALRAAAPATAPIEAPATMVVEPLRAWSVLGIVRSAWLAIRGAAAVLARSGASS